MKTFWQWLFSPKVTDPDEPNPIDWCEYLLQSGRIDRQGRRIRK